MTTTETGPAGPWWLDPAERVLTTGDQTVPLDDMTTPAAMLHALLAHAVHPDATRASVAGLAWALVRVLDPEDSLCPNGKTGRLLRRDIAKLVADAGQVV